MATIDDLIMELEDLASEYGPDLEVLYYNPITNSMEEIAFSTIEDFDPELEKTQECIVVHSSNDLVLDQSDDEPDEPMDQYVDIDKDD